MSKLILISLCLCTLLPLRGLSQLPAPATLPGYTYTDPQHYKPSWQRLYCWMSATFLVVVKEGQADIDSCMIASSRSLGIGRFAILAEGIDEPGLKASSGWIDRQDPATGIRQLQAATGNKHLQLLLLLGAYYTFQPHCYSQHLDSVEYFLTRAQRESALLKDERAGRLALCLLVKVYAQGNDDRADALCKTLLDQCTRAGDKETMASVLALRSKYTPPMGTTMERKINDASQAATIFHSIGNPEGEINALTDLGYLQLIIGQPDSAYANHLRAYQLAEAIHFPYTQYNTQALTTTTLFQGKFGEPLRYAYQTIRMAEATRDSVAWGYFYANLANMYDWENRPVESIEWAQKSLRRFTAARNTSAYLMLYSIVLQMRNQGHAAEAFQLARNVVDTVGYPVTISDQYGYHFAFSECYMGLGMLDEAEAEIRKADSVETVAAAVRGPMRRSEVDAQYAELYVLRKQYRKAMFFLKRRFENPGRMSHFMVANMNAYRQMIFIDSALGDHAAAEAHYRRYTELLDSSFRLSATRQAEELQVTYQIKEKENEINLLTQQAKLEKSNSEKASVVRDWTITGIIAVFIIAILLYRQSRLRKRSNQVITGQNEQLQQLLSDKEWLLKEVHHRVKNNLQIVMSLLDSQSEYTTNDAELAAIDDNLRRVHAMALIHQKLYQTDNNATISMQEYINELVIYARDSFDNGNRVIFEQAIEPLELDIAQAIPIGLIINESIVNALKHAFPQNRKGTVSIKFYQEEKNLWVLEIADDGVGLEPGFTPKAHASLGFELMQGLARQLNGSFSYAGNNGLRLTIRFGVVGHRITPKTLVNF